MKKPLPTIVGIAVIALGTFGSAPARAAIITFNFNGVITSVSSSLFDPSVQVGAPIRGSYTFDSTTPNNYPNDPTIGVYESSGPPYGLAVSFGSDTFLADSFTTTIYNLGPFAYIVSADINVDVPGGSLGQFYLRLDDPTQFVASSNALPVTPPTVNSFVEREINFSYAYSSSVGEIQGKLDSITAAPVPEPSPVLGYIALGTLGAVGYTLKRKASKVS